MTEKKKALLFIHDYTEQGSDRFFLWSDGTLTEVTAQQLITEDSELICHDYWLLAPAIFSQTQNLPANITDIDELRISTSGNKDDRKSKEKADISSLLGELVDPEAIKSYLSIFNKKTKLDEATLSSIGEALLELSDIFEKTVKEANEWERFIQIERPITDYLIRSTCNGIAINTNKLREHKQNIEFEYYMALKKFSAKYNMPLEVPTDDDIVDYLEPRGYNFSGVNLDYVLNFVPMPNNFAIDLLNLMKIAKSRRVLNLIPLSQERIHPITDVFGSITSRIYFKDPSLQNLAKQHRDILSPDVDKMLSYVDFDQYEAGIMAALSGDQELLANYASGDLYESAAIEIFKDHTKRKEAKRLFLSYAYGMKQKSLIDAAGAYGADRDAAKAFFRKFRAFEEWKKSVHTEYKENGRISTCFGNHMRREKAGPLTEQEKRSAVSQVVQGTASLIFKKTLLNLKQHPCIEIKVPMHDAVLFQHPTDFDITHVIKIFTETMTDHFQGKITGKASAGEFFVREATN